MQVRVYWKDNNAVDSYHVPEARGTTKAVYFDGEHTEKTTNDLDEKAVLSGFLLRDERGFWMGRGTCGSHFARNKDIRANTVLPERLIVKCTDVPNIARITCDGIIVYQDEKDGGTNQVQKTEAAVDAVCERINEVLATSIQ